jgi:hypothetical protein
MGNNINNHKSTFYNVLPEDNINKPLLKPFEDDWNWYKHNRPKRKRSPTKQETEIIHKILIKKAKQNKWKLCGSQYFCERYQCIGLICHNRKHRRTYKSEWHIAIEDLLEDLTYCPECGPKFKVKLD